MTISDATIVRLWPIPRIFQFFFIAIVIVALGLTAGVLIAPTMEPAPAGRDCESGCIYGSNNIAQDHTHMAYDTRIDLDSLIGAVIAPLMIGIVVALVASGRSMLGRAWYGAVFASMAMIVWLCVKMLYGAQDSMSINMPADAPLLSEPTLLSIAAVIVCAAADVWWQRRRYVWVRAWSLLFVEAALLTLTICSTLASTQTSDMQAVGVLVGVMAAVPVVTFLVFTRRTIHVAAKFAGLLLALSLLGGYLAGMAGQSIYGYDYVLMAVIVGVAGTYGLGAWMIAVRPAPLKS